jgi:hypothetical protein
LRPSTAIGYDVTETTQPAGFNDGTDTAGTVGGVTVGTAGNDVINGVILLPGDAGIDYNFGEIVAVQPVATISGFVYSDLNNNGIKDAGEAGIPGVTVALSGGPSTPAPVVTAADGSYSFTDLQAGTYILTETQPATFLDGKDAAGTINGVTEGTVTPPDSITSIDVTGGQSGIYYNFGEIVAATLSGFVYSDLDNDGVKDAGEAGIVGVTVTLTGTDDLGAAVNRTATTDAKGLYTFADLRPSSTVGYTVTETQPATFLDGKDTAGTVGGVTRGTAGNDTITGILLNPDDDGINYNFGELVGATLTGFVYSDLDNDGVKDAGEAGIPGTTVTLTGTNDLGAAVNQTATTDANGAYTFSNLRPSSTAGYTVTETQPATFLDGKDTAGTVGGVARGTAGNDTITGIVLNADDDGINYNFGEIIAATLTGFVYNDLDNDGVKDAGEAGIAGVTVTLPGTNDLGAAVNQTATTDANGAYTFSNLRPSSTAGYTETETQPATFLDGKDTVGTVGGVARGSAAVNDVISGIVLNSDDDGINYNFGELNFASIAGFVYNDADNDGVRDAGESGIGSVTVTLTGTNDLGAAVNQTTTTSATGAYTFSNLRPGTYVVTETQPAGFVDGKDTPGTINGTTEGVATPPDSITSIDIGAGQSGIEYNFGELVVSSLSGFVYADVNANGVKDGVEAGIPGVTVRLTGTDDLGQAVNTTVTTAANGSYSFTNLRPSSGAGYTITETHPISFIDGTDRIGTQGGTTGNDVLSAIVLNQGINGTDNNFGELGLIGGLVSKKPYITPSPLRNLVTPTDVNNDRATTALDALIVINALNAPPAAQSLVDFFMDVNGDTFLTPLDALMIINQLNKNGGVINPGNNNAGAGNNQALQAQNMTASEAFALAVDQALSQMGDDEEEDAVNPFARR